MLLSVNVFVSLDGVMQGPGNPDEDRSDGFERGGWLVPFSSSHTDEVVTGWFQEASAFLFGRTTFAMLRSYWPNVTDPENLIAMRLNSLPKYVVSSTLADQETAWRPTTILRDGALDELRRLREMPGGELQVHGSWRLIQMLHEVGLVDVYRLLQFPVIVGSGKRLFPEGAVPATFDADLDHSRVLRGGIVSLTLTRRGGHSVSAGSYVVQDGRSVTSLD